MNIVATSIWHTFDNISDPNVILSDDPVYSAWINGVLNEVIQS